MSAVDLAVAGLSGAAAVASWAAVAVSRARSASAQRHRAQKARAALVTLADRALELESVTAILRAGGATALEVFLATHVVSFEKVGDDSWEARGGDGASLGPASQAVKRPFAWFRHNPVSAAAGDLDEPRFGAMRGPLREVMARYDLDLIVPLAQRESVLGVLGLKLGRRPDGVERELLKRFRLELTAACANVQLHREAAHVLTLARELDLASAVRLALAPEDREGAVGPLEWAGHAEAVGDAGSDFWVVYPLGADRVMVVIGDAVGSGLGGTMVAAVVKSCCDGVMDEGGATVGPAELLAMLNAALYRPGSRPAHASCLAALFELGERRVTYASAGHPAPYRIRLGARGRAELGVLAGSGPLLGDSAEANFRENRTRLGEREVFLLHTNGLVKACDPAGKAYGDRRLQRLLASQAAPSPRELRDVILAAEAAHRAGTRLADDLAFVLLRVA